VGANKQHHSTVGNPVKLYHNQDRKWRRGVVTSLWGLEEGVSWPKAKGWQSHWTGEVVESVEVWLSADVASPLRWDSNCTDAIPKHFWDSDHLRVIVPGAEPHGEPCSMEEAHKFRESETHDAVMHTGAIAEGQVSEEAHVETQKLMQVRYL
jgi:hypothetical protein